MRASACAAALALALAAGGCALPGTGGAGGGPAPVAGAPATSSTPWRLAVARRTHEYPGTPARQRATGAGAPDVVIEAFATAYINWSAATVTRTMRALAGMSVGQARSEVQMAAAETARDYELQRGGIVNTGVVEAIAPLIGHRHQYAVITRERTTSLNTTAYQGLRPAWHLALATVTRLRPGRWVLSAWQPES